MVWLRFVFFSLSVLATQVFSLEMVCRCTVHGLLPLFMFAIQVFLSKMVCRCTVSLLRVLPLVTTHDFFPGMVYRCIGFTHIQVCCGCTGGQHRSVYSAEHIARHVAEKFGVRVVVTHKMQGVKYVIEAK